MGFNYAKEKAKFEIRWKTLSAEYKSAGMSQAAIDSMREFDWREFCSTRVYNDHNQPFPNTYLDNKTDEERSTVFRRFSALSATFDEADFAGRYAWIDAISNPCMSMKLKKLTLKDLDLLTFIVIEGHSQAELAHKWNCSQKAISRRFIQIKKFLAKPV